jgi:hypothetical protein
MGIIDRLRSLFGRPKDADGDGADDVVEEAEAITTVRHDIERSGLDAVDRLSNTPGSSDRGTWG